MIGSPGGRTARTTDVPVVDIAALRRSPASDEAVAGIGHIDAACVETGFFVVTGHGLGLTEILDAARRFFATAQEDKERSAMVANNGYASAGSRRGDGKEMLDIGLTGFERWPDLAGFRDVVERYQGDALAAAHVILRALAIALDVEPSFFADRMKRPQCFLRLLHRPADGGHRAAPPAVTTGAHTDYGTITLLATDGTPGLEVRPVGRDWLPVVAPADSLIVNLGDMLARWTNGRYVSTPHRVLDVTGQARLSVPFFVNPDPGTEVTCIPSCFDDAHPCRFEPITAGEFLQGRIDGTIPTGDGIHR